MLIEEKKETYKDIFLRGLFKENSLLVLALGICPALKTTSSLESSFGMGILFTIVFILTCLTANLLRKLIPSNIRIPIFIVIIASEVTIFDMLIKAFLPDLASSLGVFISLITVNCIVLGRIESYASKETFKKTFFDCVGIGFGYLIALCIIGFLREFLGTGTIYIGKIFPLEREINLLGFLHLDSLKLTVFNNAPGAFLIMGLLLAFINVINAHKKNKNKEVK